MNRIILSNDYEISGDGSSSVLDLIKKTNNLQKKLDDYNIKQSLFPDICEYYSFKKYDKELSNHFGYSPYAIFKNQLENLHSNKNDIQLHFHPQWYGAKFINGKWLLNKNLWRITSSTLDLKKFIKKYLTFFKNEFPHINIPIVFRAGGYCIQPIKNLFQVLKEYNICYDSSVAINTFKYDHIKYFNFNSNIKNRKWNFENDLLIKESCGSFTELPIASVCLDNYFKNLLKKLYNNKNSLKYFRRFSWKNSFRRIDFTVMSSEQLIKSIYQYLKLTESDSTLILLTGHSKHFNGNDLTLFFNHFTESKHFEFVTLSQYISENYQ